VPITDVRQRLRRSPSLRPMTTTPTAEALPACPISLRKVRKSCADHTIPSRFRECAAHPLQDAETLNYFGFGVRDGLHACRTNASGHISPRPATNTDPGNRAGTPPRGAALRAD